jgi:hypothetical protein
MEEKEETEEEKRKDKIYELWSGFFEIKNAHLEYCYAHMSITYELLEEFKDLHPNYFFTSFLLIIDNNTESFPITEKLHEMFVKIMPYLEPNMRIMTYLKNLSFYRFCIDVGYKKVNYLPDVRMPVRVGVINPVCDTFNETPYALRQIRYTRSYLTTV